KIQSTLVEIYTYLVKDSLHGKRGYLKDRLLAKAIDYASRSVISAPRIKSETWDTQKIPFTHTGVPLSQLCALFFPFFVKYIKDFLSERLESTRYIWNQDRTQRYELEDPMEQFTSEEISRIMNLYIKSPSERFTRLEITTKE